MITQKIPAFVFREQKRAQISMFVISDNSLYASPTHTQRSNVITVHVFSGAELVPGSVVEFVRRGKPQALAGRFRAEQVTRSSGQNQPTGHLHPIESGSANHRAIPTC